MTRRPATPPALLRSTAAGMATGRGRSARTIAAVRRLPVLLLLLPLLRHTVAVETARVNKITPRNVGFAGGEIAILGSGFAGDQSKPERGISVHFVNDWDTIQCKVIEYKTSNKSIVCTVGALRVDRGLGNWYKIQLVVNGTRVHSGWSIQYVEWYTPRVDSLEPSAGLPGSLVTLRGRFFTDRYSIDTKTAGDLQPSDLSIARIQIGSKDCDPVDQTSGELYGITSSAITCRTSASQAGPLSVQLMVTGRGLSAMKNNNRLVSSRNSTYDFLAVPQVTEVRPTSLAAGGGAVLTVDGVGFDPERGATTVTIGGADCRVLTVTSTRVTCAAPIEADTTAQMHGGSGLQYEVWLDAEVSDLGDLSTLTPDSDGYHSEVLLGAVVTNNSFGQAAAAGEKFVGRLSGWLKSPRLGQFVLTLKSDGAAQLRLGAAPDSFESESVVETSGNFNSLQKSAIINMTYGQMVYFEATHMQGSAAGGYRLQVGLIDYSSPVTRYQTGAATADIQTIYIKGDLRQEQQVLSFEDVPSQALSAVQLVFNGVLSQTPVDASTATEDTWREAVEDMFSAQCTYDAVEEAWMRTYEENKPETGRETGTRKREAIEPWCGYWVMYKPWGGIWTANTNQEIQLARHPWFCFAHWGQITGQVRVLVDYRDDENQWIRRWKYFNADLPSSQSWTYSCVDLIDKLEDQITMPAKLREVRVSFSHANDVYFDDVSFSAAEKTPPVRRPAARLGSGPLFVREVQVTTSADPLSVAVTLNVAACVSELPLIGVAGTNATAVTDTSRLSQLTMSAEGWGQGAVTNLRNASASPAPTGTWDIMFSGHTVQGVPTNLSSEAMTLLLSTRLSLPGLVVQRWGECDKYHWNVMFSHHGGKQPDITVNGSNVQFSGDNLQVGVWKDPNNGDGRVTHDVLPADLTRLPRSAAGRQVKVTVAGVVGQCAADCDVTYDADLNAAVTLVSSETDEASGDTTVTITGSGLGSAPEGIQVTLTGAVMNRSCAVTAATGSEVTCTVKNLQAGRYAVAVTVTDAGMASGSGEVSAAPRLLSASPAEGSPRGGTVITLRGRRMPQAAAGWQDANITVGGATCRVINSTSTATSCRLEGDVGAAGSAVDITVSFGDRSTSLEGAFTTLATNAAITALNVTSASAAGGGFLGITGSGFGRLQRNQSVTVGGASCNVTSWGDTQIVCRLPPLGHGTHRVEVIRGQLGLADTTGVSPISTVFKVSDISPRLVSAAGGSVIRLRGEGLAADCQQLDITAGHLFTCEPVNCTDTEVTCRLQRRRRRHVIRNNVTHPRYGPGFLWEPQSLTVAPGDLVSWRWSLGQASSASVAFAVHQTASQHTDQYKPGGFNSGDRTQQGSFTTMLEDIGTVFYSGPPAGVAVPRMRGVINVAAPPVGDSVISVRIGAVEATHVPTETTVPAFEPAELCSADTTPASCPDSEDPLLLQSAECVTPRVTEVTVTPGGQSGVLTADSELIISGSGFSSTACHNRVLIGAGSCDVTAAAANQLTCQVTAAGLPHGDGQPLELRVANRGEAVIGVAESSKYFRWEPTVSGVTPASGSPTGETLLTVSGSGLISGHPDIPPRVTVGTAECVVQSVTLSELTCLTPAGAVGDPVPVTLIWVDEDRQPRTVGNATFTYDATKTPVLSSVEASSGDQRTLTITGNKFGSDASKVIVHLIPKVSAESRRRRRRRQADSPPPDDALHTVDDEPDYDDVTALDSDDVISMDIADEVEPALEEARREDAAFWRRFCHGSCDSFDGFVSSGQLRAAGSGPAVPVTVPTPPSPTPEDEQDFIELTPEYVSAFHEAALGGSRARRRVHLRRRRSISSASPTQEINCASVTLTEAGVTCQPPDSVSGSFDVQVRVSDMGVAAGTVTVAVKPSVTTSSLPAGSQHGGARIQLDGAGFGEDVSVTIGGSECRVTATTATRLECLTPAGQLGAQPLVVMSGGLSVNGPEYEYSADSTPVLTSVTSEDTSDVSVLSGMGSGLGTASGTYLTVGGRRCTTTSLLDTEVTCQLESHLPGGQHIVTFHSPEGTGDSAPVELSVPLEVTSVSPATAGLSGTTLTIVGGKFDTVSPITVTVCDTPCQVTAVTSTAVTCLAPAVSAAPEAACDVIVTLSGGASVSSDAAFTYDESLRASATSVTPTRGGTAGGTTITVTGADFAETGNTVTIDGVTCDVTSESVTQVVCVTNAHVGPGQFSVLVDVPGVGFAEPGADAQFQYVDRWSSPFTWGGADPPSNGQSVSITAGQTILLDTSTPVLRLIIIDGGKLIFDPDAAFLELNAEYIMVVGGGSVQIGTEESPHQGQAAITLHGNVRATELPVYGAKVLAVREGTLDLHGRPIDITWTYLDSTAAAGDSSIVLDRAVSWAVGDEIVIASTGDKFSMGESEKHVISAVSADGLTLTLESPLAFEHISSEQTFAGETVRMRAEVGLLTRNVKVRGSINEEFTKQVEACAAGFSPGQFDVQTCFHGRYGAETITDQFGATVMIHAKYQNQHLVTGRIEYVEVTEAGQAFRLGRYPIHFHLNGNVTGSYVRGCAIHRTYNRAVTIHAVDYLLVEHNVAYNNMGHAFFTEDGIEAYNVIQYNLAVFTRTSSSLLNVDVTPASYWVVNPTNIVRHNAAAGGTHFGYWYRTEAHPSGPSFTNSYCPNHAPMGEFYNNSAHSFGRYGLWVFSMDGYFPLSGGEDTCSGAPDVARFGQFLAWRCERGAEVVFGGALRFENFTVVDNEMSGLEMVKVKGPFGQDGPGVQNALVVGRSSLAGDACTKSGIITPKQYIFNVDGATFVNFDKDSCTALSACSQCKLQQGGFHHQFRRIVYDNSPNKMKWKWTHESVFHDTDGSLSGEEDGALLPWTDILPPDHCSKGLAGFDVNSQVVTGVCDSSVSIHRMAFNQPKPTSLLYKKVNFTTQHGTTSSYWQKKRLTHASGWMALLVGGETHNIEFADSNQLTNISYDADFYFLKSEDRLAVSHVMLQKPDRFQAGGAPSNGSGPPLDLTAGTHGDIHWDNDTYTLSYLVAGQSRSRRAAGPFEDRDKGVKKDVKLVVERCFFEGCIPPPVPTVPTGRPDTVQLWSQATEGKWSVPGEMEDVTIPADLWVLTDVTLPPINRLVIYGVLEIGDDMDNVLSCTHIIVYGKLIAGTVEQPFQNQLTIQLRGRHQKGSDSASADFPMPAGTPNVGWKTLATFGGLELYGTPRSVQWTSLSASAPSGSSGPVRLASPVDWPVGAEVVITTSSFESRETEVKRVTDVSEDGTQLTLNDTLLYDHLATEVALPGGQTRPMAAKVGLLTRNIRIEGDSYDGVMTESFGARVLASSYTEESTNVKKTASVRLSNVEFRLAGQDGWSDSYDPRYALALHSLGDTDATIADCSFNHLFSPAIGIFYSNNVTVSGSVIMHTVGSGIIDEGTGNRLENNLVSWLVFPGTYNNRDEPDNLSWDAAFRVNKAKELILVGNVVAGSERLGFHIGGTDCSGQSSWANNEAHGALHGVHMFGRIKLEQCAKVSGFFVWRSWDFGIYFHVPSSSIVIDDNLLVENTINILPMLYEPNPVAHQYENKRITISNTVVVAVAEEASCASDRAPAIASFRAQVRAPRTSTGGRTGIVWAQFLARKVGAPKKTWHKPMSYPAVRGNTYLSGVQLVNFNRLCSDQRDLAISTLGGGDDAQHPLISDTVSFTNVNSDDKLFMHKPSLSRVNPSDCVDMDCDGQKHALLIDTDGSVIGSAGTAVPLAEYEFDGDERHGIGYYRVPVSAVTGLRGARIPYADKMPNKGVWRGSDCTWRAPWRAYTCPGGQQRMLVIESMDDDTESRRVSPIALIGNPGPAGFVDLLNGPQDMGWCFGYTCQERLSTFYSLVAPGRVYEMHFTGTPPQHLRFHFLNAEPDMTIVLKIWYPKSQRYDVYHEDKFVFPTNVDPETSNFIQSENPEEFKPKVTSDKHGENYFQRREGFLHVVIRGGGVVEIIQQPVIILTIGAVAKEEFFDSDVVNRIADLLDISASQMRTVDIVPEDSGPRRRRRRRETARTEVEFEIGPAPAANASSNDTSSMSIEKLQETQAKVVDKFQKGEMDQALGVKVEGLKMVDPVPPPVDPTGGVRATNETGGEDLSGVEGVKTYSQLQREQEEQEAAAKAESAAGVSYEKPSELVLESAAVSGEVQELTRLSPLIKLYMKDSQGERMSAVGHASSPWQVQAELVSPPSGLSLLQDRVSFVAGVATFSRLMVSGVATGLKLRFKVVQPSDADFSVDMPGSFATLEKELEVRVAGNPGEAWHKPGEKISPGVRVELRDPATGGLATAAALRGHTWLFQAALYKHADGTPSAALQGTRRLELAPPSGESTYDPAVVFNDLKITPAGWSYLIKFTVTSPDDTSVKLTTVAGPFQIQSKAPSNLPVIHTIGTRIKADFSSVSNRQLQFAAEVNSFLQGRYSSSQFTGVTLSEGSIRVVSTTRDGSEESHRRTVAQLRKDLGNGLVMTAADGTSYRFDGSLLVDGAPRRQRWTMPPWTLALICVMATLLFVGILVLIWICCCNTIQRGKVEDVNHMAFKVPINSVPPPPFTPGAVNSFNIRMSIMDPNHKVAPSVIQVTSDDPLANMEDVRLDEFSAPVSPLASSPRVPASGSAPLPAPDSVPEPSPAGVSETHGEVGETGAAAQESEEQRLQREAKQAQEKAEKQAEETRRAEKAKAEETEMDMDLDMDLFD